MDNWAWVNELSDRLAEQGQGRLAQLIHEIPNHNYDGRDEMVDALVPEALAAARGLNIPWLEVYFKHWSSASRIRRFQGEVMLGDMVSAYELAHQEKNQRCPQSVCTTQDLVGVYGNVDGPGWAGERLAACDETLGRIDPSWTCFGCISIERACAMGDMGPEHARQAVIYLQDQTTKGKEAGEDVHAMFVTTIIEQWLLCGEADKALEVLDATESEVDKNDEREQRSRGLFRSRALAMAGRAREAQELMPSFNDLPQGNWVSWCRAMADICVRETKWNQASVGQSFWSTLDLLHRGGSHRILIDLALIQASLADARQVPWMAQAALALAEQHRLLLRQDLGAQERLARAQAAHASATPSPLPCAATELLTWLNDAEDTKQLARETIIQWLFTAREELPDDEDLLNSLSYHLTGHGYHDLARRQLQTMVLERPQSSALQGRWFELCMSSGDLKGIEEQARRIESVQPAQAAWFRAQLAFKRERFEQVGPLIEQLLSHDPNGLSAKRLWADAAMKMKDFDTAVRLRQELLALETEPGNQAWGLLIAASAARNWAIVRTQAQALNMTLQVPENGDENAAVDEDWGWIRLRYDADKIDLMAKRTGPATARIVQPAPRTLQQHMGDWVVFEPIPLEQPPEDEEERRHYRYIYAEPFHVLEAGNYSPTYFIDGVHPGDEALEKVREAIDTEGWVTWRYSGSGYRLRDPDAASNQADEKETEEDTEDEGLPGIYMGVATPASVNVQDIEAKIRALCEDMQLCWPALAEAAGQPAGRHEKITQLYEL